MEVTSSELGWFFPLWSACFFLLNKMISGRAQVSANTQTHKKNNMPIPIPCRYSICPCNFSFLSFHVCLNWFHIVCIKVFECGCSSEFIKSNLLLWLGYRIPFLILFRWMLFQYFVEAGAIAVRRVRKEDLRHVAKATGASLVCFLIFHLKLQLP